MANTPQTYTSAFRSLTPEKLAAIIINEQDYNVDAVKAARLELTARMLPMEELDRLYALAEEQKIKSGSDGMHIGIGDNKKVELLRKSFRERTKSSIWTRTSILKLIYAYLLFSFSLSVYYIVSSIYYLPAYDESLDMYITTLISCIDPLIIGALIWIGLKGHRAAWWGAMLLFLISFLLGIFNIYNTYLYYQIYDIDVSGLSGLFLILTDDPLTTVLKLGVPGLCLYLLLRKDTRIACGVSKAEPKGVDDLDHLI